MSDDSIMDDSLMSGSEQTGGRGQGDTNYSNELLTKKVKGRQRTFFIDLKQSSNGKFIKISELSRGGKRSTIMFDGEDIDAFLEAFQEIKQKL